MRLIDADTVKKAFIGNRYGTKAIEYVIDNVPTVEAIPIEWIEKFIDNDILSETVKILLNAWYWEKENEQNKDNTSQTD